MCEVTIKLSSTLKFEVVRDFDIGQSKREGNKTNEEREAWLASQLMRMNGLRKNHQMNSQKKLANIHTYASLSKINSIANKHYYPSTYAIISKLIILIIFYFHI